MKQKKAKRDETGNGPVETSDGEFFAAVCKALGHPARLQIVAYLQSVDQCICGQIVERLPLAQSTVSQHLKTLKKAGLIRGEVEGPRTCYCIDPQTLERFKRLCERL